MRKVRAVIILVAIAFLLGCQSIEQNGTFIEYNGEDFYSNEELNVESDSTDQPKYEPVSDSEPFQLPEMTEEQQYFYNEYVRTMLFNSMLIFDWSQENYRHDPDTPPWASLAGNLMFAFEDIIGQDAMSEIWETRGINIPAEIVEEVLLRYFPFTVEQIREMLYLIYDEENNVYVYSGGRGGGPRAGVVTNVERQGEFVKLSYEIYTPSIGGSVVDTLWISGILTLKEIDDRFMYWSVSVVYKAR